MSLTLKLSSLAIRTLSKPIATHLKAQAREHERFRKICVSMAQALHKFDMRLRLGSIRDNTASQRQAAAEKAAKKHIPTSPTAKTEAETKAEEQAIAKAKAAAEEAAKPHNYRIRPLSESKAIESGANFISESFLFLVAGGLIVFEAWRSRRKESTRREGVEERLAELEQSEKTTREALVALEKELLALRAEKSKSTHRILPRAVWEQVPELDEPEVEQTWWSSVTSYFTFGQESKTPEPTPQPTLPQTAASQDSKATDASVEQPATSAQKKNAGAEDFSACHC
ncbi:uncharacterized protein N7484_010462 [Penicillium longicatenatum]|uniref:uncharacterized protein n=1 Tax=Penicillium longicatenatum TaxID=1561947 RepID=UPI002549580B|nr:uncharacterized protein N7484_010462 [Penicillium longicatenatum]KAJ5630362.1 hypothetical protein N7484_010462 [Penicillium longicatenatum]